MGGCELSSGQGSNGETVYAWYLHGDPASVALGIGGDVLFVESVTVDPDDPDQVDVTAWPEAEVTLPRTATENPDIGTLSWADWLVGRITAEIEAARTTG